MYDLMEPFRPICDAFLIKFYLQNNFTDIKEWAKYFAKEIIKFKIHNLKHGNMKLINFVDIFVEKVGNCFEQRNDNEYIKAKVDFNNLFK